MTFNVIEKEFQRGRTSAYQLSILIGVDSLVYSVYEGTTEQLLLLKSLSLPPNKNYAAEYASELDSAIGREDFLHPVYQKVRIAFHDVPVSLVPTRLYNEEEKATYIEGLTSQPADGEVYTDTIEPLRLRVVCKLNEAVTDVVKARFSNVRIFNAATPFLIGSHRSIPEGVEETAFACFREKSFQLALFRQGGLLFYNRFEYQAASDVLYFLLLAYEQHGLDPDHVPLFLSGHLLKDSEIYKILYRYVADVSFLPGPSYVRFGKSISSLDPNLLFPLHALLLC